MLSASVFGQEVKERVKTRMGREKEGKRAAVWQQSLKGPGVGFLGSYCQAHSLWLNAYNNLVTIRIRGASVGPSGFDSRTMQGALSTTVVDQCQSEA